MEINGKRWWRDVEEELKKWSNKNVVKYSMNMFCVKSFNIKNRILSNILKFCVFLSMDEKKKIQNWWKTFILNKNFYLFITVCEGKTCRNLVVISHHLIKLYWKV